MSVTKTCLDVLQDLGNAFSQAIRPEGLHKPDIVAPYIVENDTGFDVTLNLKRGAFFLHTSHLPTGAGNDEIVRSGVIFQSLTTSGTELSPEEVTTCRISPGARAYLQGKKEDSMNALSAFSSLNKDSQNDMFLHVQVRGESLNWLGGSSVPLLEGVERKYLSKFTEFDHPTNLRNLVVRWPSVHLMDFVVSSTDWWHRQRAHVTYSQSRSTILPTVSWHKTGTLGNSFKCKDWVWQQGYHHQRCT